MAFQSVPGTWQFSLQGVLPNGRPWVNNLYVEFDTYVQPTTSAANAFMAVIHDAYTDNSLDDKLSTGWQFSRLVVTGLENQTDAQVVSTTSPVTGTDGSNPLPEQTALVINWLTNSRGRSYRGRNYLPGFTEAQSSGADPVAGVFTAVDGWANDLITGFSDTGRRMVVVSRFSGTDLVPTTHGQVELRPVPRDPAITTEITDYAIDNKWKTQRRRQSPG